MMVCRRCGGEIPDESEICPRCGMTQQPYITPRKPEPYKKPKLSRSRTLSMLSVLVIIIVAVVIFTAFNESNKNSLLAEIEDAYNAGDLEVLASLATSFVAKYPKTDEAKVAQNYYDMLVEELKEQKREELTQEKKLLAENADKILQVTSIRPEVSKLDGFFDLRVEWYNRTNKVIEEVRYLVEGFDSSGAPAVCAEKEESRVWLVNTNNGPFGPNAENEPVNSLYYNVWKHPDVAKVELHQIVIEFEDGTSLYVTQDIVEHFLSGDAEKGS